jgi:hypothetical protein
MQAAFSETEQRVADLVDLHRVVPGAEAAVAPLTTHAKVNIMVCTIVETRGLVDAGSRRRLCEQPYHRYRLDARREAQGLRPSRIEVIERAGRMEDSSTPASELLSRAEDP